MINKGGGGSVWSISSIFILCDSLTLMCVFLVTVDGNWGILVTSVFLLFSHSGDCLFLVDS